MNVYKRGKSYSYRFEWTIKNPDGSSESFVIRRSARAGSKKAALEAAEEHRRALRLGLIHPRDAWPPAKEPEREAATVGDFGKRFLEYAAAHTKPGTARFYGECIERVLRFEPLATAVLTDVTSELLTKYSNWRRAQKAGNSLATVNGELRTLRRLFNLAEEWAEIGKAPAVHELPGNTSRERVLTFAEEREYLKHASATLQTVTILAVDTGLRPDSELFTMEWRNVALDAKPGAPHGFIHVPAGKTEYARRNVPLTSRSKATLEMRKAANGQSRYVFPGDGKSGHLTSIQHPHERAIRDADLESFEFYCWRHTFGTRCAESGMDKFSLARLMGHSSPRVAERYYVHVTEPHVSAGFERFAEYVAKKQVEAVPAITEAVQ